PPRSASPSPRRRETGRVDQPVSAGRASAGVGSPAPSWSDSRWARWTAPRRAPTAASTPPVPAGRPHGIEGAHHARGPRRLHHHPRRLRVGRGVARLLGPGGPGVPGLAHLQARGHLPDGGEHVPADVRVRGGRGPPPPPPPPRGGRSGRGGGLGPPPRAPRACGRGTRGAGARAGEARAGR